MACSRPLLLLQLLALLAVSATAAHKKETHLRFFWHDVLTRPNSTSVRVMMPPNAIAANGFGTVVVIDNALTEGPDIASRLVGRAQGFYVLDSQSEASLLMSMNLAFTEGKYKGSSLAVLGRDPVNDAVREMPVLGSSRRFRLARGYVLLKTYSFNATTKNAVVEHNVYVKQPQAMSEHLCRRLC